jgi:hypothetical protein
LRENVDTIWLMMPKPGRMTEEPEQVLEQDRIAALRRFEERGSEISVREQHGDRTRKHRHRQQQQECRYQDRPDE